MQADLVRQYNAWFIHADINDDQELDLDEFTNALPEAVRSKHNTETIKKWFDSADEDKNGMVSLYEFVQWSMQAASLATGKSAVELFQKYDRDRTGTLDRNEFVMGAKELGFGEYAHDLFDQLPRRRDGTVSYYDIIDQMKGLRGMSKTMNSFILAMASNGVDQKKKTGTVGWSFKAADAESARLELAALLKEKGVQLFDLFAVVDSSNNQLIDMKEFVHLMEKTLGFEGPRSVVHDVFKAIDEDSSGAFTFGELHAWLKGRRITKAQRMEAIARLTISERIDRNEPPWNVARLRREVCCALKEANVRTTDLLDSWDKDGSKTLRKKEWLVRWKTLANVPDDVWLDKMRDAVLESFVMLDTDGSKELSIAEIDAWLQVLKGGAPAKKPVPTTGRPRSSPRPLSAAPVKPGWRPVGRRPVWPLDKGLLIEQKRPTIPPATPRRPGTARPRSGVLDQLALPGVTSPTEGRTRFCELREIPLLRKHAGSAPVHPRPPPEVVFISRKLNWPPKGFNIAELGVGLK